MIEKARLSLSRVAFARDGLVIKGVCFWESLLIQAGRYRYKKARSTTKLVKQSSSSPIDQFFLYFFACR